MDLKNYSTGVQHIGIPTNDIDKTVDFYHKLGFETAFETVNEEADEKVVFLKLGTLVVEAYENHVAVFRAGAIDHVALDVKDIEEIYQYVNQAGLNTTQDWPCAVCCTSHHLCKFFIICNNVIKWYQ